MKLKFYASKKVITILLSTMLLLGGILTQHTKIKTLENEINKQAQIQQDINNSDTFINISTIRTALNKECEFKILDGNINIKHKYDYMRNGNFGLKHTNTIVGSASFYYSMITDLRNASIDYVTNEAIQVTVDIPELDSDSCHRVPGSFIRIDDECDKSLLSNKKDVELATRAWEDSFNRMGKKVVEEYYSYSDVRSNLENNTIKQIQTLFKQLGYRQKVIVNIRYSNMNTEEAMSLEDTLRK